VRALFTLYGPYGLKGDVMRKGTQDVQFLERDDQSLWGVSLGWDYTFEHEHGIFSIRQAFGVPAAPTRKKIGVDARKVTIIPEGLRLFKDEARGFLYVAFGSDFEGGPDYDLEFLDSRLGAYEDTEIAAAWSEDDFAIRVKTSVHGEKLQAIYDALKNKDACLFLGSTSKPSPFSRSSLILTIASALTKSEVNLVKKQDSERLDLEEAAKATGIEARLEKAGLGYYALSPSWRLQSRVGHGKIQTRHKVMFYLNPKDQQRYDSGWFTVEELDLWIKGKGPVIKKQQTA
jgi:hypothetical protein